MSTINQEKIYNDIIEYYSFAQRLLNVIENDSNEFLDQHFDIINDVIVKLEKSVENLSINYIEIIKNGNSSELIQKIRESLNEISGRIEECRNKILILYNTN
jgi:hypothetical protein